MGAPGGKPSGATRSFSDPETVPPAQHHKDAAQPFNTAQPMTVLKDKDGPPVVTQRLKNWSQIVKDVATDYQAHW